eukprot:gb/GECH01005843.1/.p1 GENE.gb/GECH01005843.1/~~gb/GECH01005843.1/.p1  ORF type:complete len:113 (+),score=8.46 gb/GECH01005843.1/:1-339(+)
MSRACLGRHYGNGELVHNYPAPQQYRQSKYHNSFPYVDVYHAKTSGEVTQVERCPLPTDHMFPLQTIHILNHTYRAPRDGEVISELVYGQNWKTPIKASHGSNWNCKNLKNT